MSDADRLAISYAEESAFGTSPTGSYTVLRITGESLQQVTDSVTSNEIRNDRQITDVIRTGVHAEGSVNFEFSYGTFDDFMRASVGSSAWSSAVSLSTLTLTVAGAGPTYTVTRSAGSWVSDGMLVNQWVKFGGFATAGNNNVFKITNVAALILTVSYGTMTAEGPTASCTAVMGAQVVNGTTLKSFSIERNFSDLTNIYALNKGMTIESFSLEVTTDGIVTGSFAFMGSIESNETSSPGSGYTAAPTGEVMNAVDHVSGIFEDGTTVDLTNFKFTIKNNLRDRQRIGTLGVVSMGAGKIECSGSIEGYFSAQTQIAKYLAWTASDLVIAFKDSAGARYVFEFVKVKFTTGPRNATSQNSDVMQSLNFTAMRDPTETITVRITRWA